MGVKDYYIDVFKAGKKLGIDEEKIRMATLSPDYKKAFRDIGFGDIADKIIKFDKRKMKVLIDYYAIHKTEFRYFLRYKKLRPEITNELGNKKLIAVDERIYNKIF